MSLRTATYTDIVSSFEKAIIKEENVSDDGFINWDFVDADICLDMSDANIDMPEDYYGIFDYLVKIRVRKGEVA